MALTFDLAAFTYSLFDDPTGVLECRMIKAFGVSAIEDIPADVQRRIEDIDSAIGRFIETAEQHLRTTEPNELEKKA